MKRKITICIANQKGGTAKTTTAVTIATGLAGWGYPVVLADLDSQGNIGHFLDLEPRPTVYELVIKDKWNGFQMVENYPSLVVFTSDQTNLEIEDALNRKRVFEPTTAIAKALKPVQRSSNGKPVITILDTAPSLSALQVSALFASDWLIIPAAPEFAGETGVAALASSVEYLQSNEGAEVNLLGILPALVDMRYKEHITTVQSWEKRFPGLVLHIVRKLSAIAEAPGVGQPIWDYAPGAALDYGRVLNEIGKRIGL